MFSSVCLCVPTQEREDIGRLCRCLTSQQGPTAVKSVMSKTPKRWADWLHIELQQRTDRTDVCGGGRARGGGRDRQSWDRGRRSIMGGDWQEGRVEHRLSEGMVMCVFVCVCVCVCGRVCACVFECCSKRMPTDMFLSAWEYITQQEMWKQWLMNMWFPHLPLHSSCHLAWSFLLWQVC